MRVIYIRIYTTTGICLHRRVYIYIKIKECGGDSEVSNNSRARYNWFLAVVVYDDAIDRNRAKNFVLYLFFFFFIIIRGGEINLFFFLYSRCYTRYTYEFKSGQVYGAYYLTYYISSIFSYY